MRILRFDSIFCRRLRGKESLRRQKKKMETLLCADVGTSSLQHGSQAGTVCGTTATV